MPQATSTSRDRGKIQLKWNKGGKEKVATNLVAFEESESSSEEEGKEGKEGGEERKTESRQAQMRTRGKVGARQMTERPSRWSKAKEHPAD